MSFLFFSMAQHTPVGQGLLDEWSVRRRLLPNNTQHSQEADNHASCRIRNHNPSKGWPQTHALVRAATGIVPVFISACYYLWICNFCLLGCDVILYQSLEVRPPRNYGKRLPDYAASHSKAPQIFSDLNPRNSSVCLQSFYISTKRLFTVDISRRLFLVTSYLGLSLMWFSGPGSLVGITTGYGLDGPWIESRWRRHFPHMSRPALGSTLPSLQWVPGLSRR